MAALPPGIADFIAAGRVGRLGTADAAGQPHVVPFCYAWDGGVLYSAVDAKPKTVAPRALRRIRDIEANPSVCVVIDAYDEDWSRLRWVQIQGRAEVLGGGPEYAHGVDLLCAKYAQYRAMGLDRREGVMIKITPRRITAWPGEGAAGAEGERAR